MPYYFETNKIRLPKENDARRKLSDADRDMIRFLYSAGHSIRAIARRYAGKCCRRTIQYVLFPERARLVNYPGHWAKYYDKDKHRAAMKKHRRRKSAILKKGAKQ